jgi:hypothetical protein
MSSLLEPPRPCGFEDLPFEILRIICQSVFDSHLTGDIHSDTKGWTTEMYKSHRSPDLVMRSIHRAESRAECFTALVSLSRTNRALRAAVVDTFARMVRKSRCGLTIRPGGIVRSFGAAPGHASDYVTCVAGSVVMHDFPRWFAELMFWCGVEPTRNPYGRRGHGCDCNSHECPAAGRAPQECPVAQTKRPAWTWTYVLPQPGQLIVGRFSLLPDTNLEYSWRPKMRNVKLGDLLTTKSAPVAARRASREPRRAPPPRRALPRSPRRRGAGR